MTTPPKNDSKVRMRDVHLAFGVELNEEYVTLHATCDGTVYDVTSRMPKYDLLVLARKRLADAASDLPEGECGVRMDNWHSLFPPTGDRSRRRQRAWFGVTIYKIRVQFAGLPIEDPGCIVERRSKPGTIRIGTRHLTVAPLEQLKRGE